jgi:CubicO group peptidase (beta-lactamase class C family)
MDDMVLWGQALLQNKLVSEEKMDTMFTFYTLMLGEGDNFHTGLGWFMSNFDGRYYSASMPGVDLFGFKTDMVVFPNDNLMWVILANQDVNSSTIGDTLSRMVFEEK